MNRSVYLRPLFRLTNNPVPRSAHPITYILLGFLLIYLLLIHYCRAAFYRDPTSTFFSPSRGYERVYSLQRQAEASTFIEAHRSASSTNTHKRVPKLCIGIATIARDNNEQYIRNAVGSLLDGLSPSERHEIYLAVLIAHTTPEDHPIYEEPWLTAVVDKVLLYDLPKHQIDELIVWEAERNYVRKAIVDYTYVMQKCVDTGAPWVAMVEDDTLAVRGWYPRVMKALARADDQYRVSESGASPAREGGEWLYLRMFFTEEFLGWNIEELPWYILASVGVVLANVFGLVLLRGLVFGRRLTNIMIAVEAFICVPALIALYFMAGRLSMQPLKPGVHEMSKFGCCAQGLVFSSSIAPAVISQLREVGAGFVDEIIEAWANRMGYVRWVAVPSILQHVGGHSSKGDDFGDQSKYERSVAEKIWNFGFEMYDNQTLEIKDAG